MNKEYEKQIKEKLEDTISEELEKVSNIKDKEERLIKLNYLFNIYKILENYDELEQTLKEFFEKQKQDRKFRPSEGWDSISK